MGSLKVEDYMTRDVITVSATDTVRDVISLIKNTKHDGFPVVKQGKIIGYVSSIDILLCDQQVKVADIMSAMSHDKKVLESKVRFVLLKAIGHAFVSDEVSPASR